MSNYVDLNDKPDYDSVLQELADYVLDYPVESVDALDTARYCLMDSLGCAMLALAFPECRKMLGPIVPGAELDQGVRIPGTPFKLDPVQAAFNIGMLVRWLDFNDTWLAAEWGHPSDNLGAILAVADYVSRQARQAGKRSLTMQDVLIAMVKAHEIQGCFALLNSFNRVGLDHVILVKLASAAVVSKMLGLDRDGILRTLSQVFVDGQSLRTYRHAPNAGSRKSWAAGDATARAVFLALLTKRGEMGYPSALTASKWGFYDVLFKGKPFEFQRPLGSYVMENVLFKLSYPAEFHAQTAVECAVILHAMAKDKLDSIERIELKTHESAIRIISKTGPLHNPADRDHCLQYMVAVALLEGDLTAHHYEDDYARNPMIDAIRDKMLVSEEPRFSADYHDPDKRSIANSMRLCFKDGTMSDWVTVEYPIGHKRRRQEGLPVLEQKFKNNISQVFDAVQCTKITDILTSANSLASMAVDEFMDMWHKPNTRFE